MAKRLQFNLFSIIIISIIIIIIIIIVKVTEKGILKIVMTLAFCR